MVDLSKMLEYFDSDIKHCSLYNSLIYYTTSTNTFDEQYPNDISLIDINGKHVKLNDLAKSKFNLLVFWGSWCGPCRNEIPVLKKIYEKFHEKGFSITSIAIHDSKSNWNAALKVEQMKWNQLYADDIAMDKLQQYFQLNAIPKSYIFDSNRKLVAKFLGFDGEEKTIKSFEEILGKF